MKRLLSIALCLCLLLSVMVMPGFAADDAELLADQPQIYLEFRMSGISSVDPLNFRNPEQLVTYNLYMYQDPKMSGGTEVADTVGYLYLGIGYDSNLTAPTTSYVYNADPENTLHVDINESNHAIVLRYNNGTSPISLSSDPELLMTVSFKLPDTNTIQGYGTVPIGTNGLYLVKDFSLLTNSLLDYEIVRQGNETGVSGTLLPQKVGGTACKVYVDASQLKFTNDAAFAHFSITDKNTNAPIAPGALYDLRNGAAFTVTVDPGYHLVANDIGSGATAPVAYTTAGSTDICTPGTFAVPSSGGVYDIPAGSIRANATLLLSAEANPYDLTVNFSNANPDDPGDKAVFTPDSGIAGTGSPFVITPDDPAVFEVTPDTGYAVKKVSYVPTDNPGATPVVLTPDGSGKYTIPDNDITKPITLTIDTAIDTDLLGVYTDIVNKVTGGLGYGQYCVYTQAKSLVLFKNDANLTGLEINIGGQPLDIFECDYTIDGEDYRYATIMDLSGLSSVSMDAVEAYMEKIVKPAAAANEKINAADYLNYNVNSTPGFQLADLSNVYDFTSRTSLNWTPTIRQLLLADVVKTSQSSQKLRVDPYDVADFLNHYIAVLNTP